MIPLVNLQSQYSKLRPEILAAVDEVFQSSAFIQGKYVANFEEKLKRFHPAKSVIGCSNGTSALSIALAALGVGKNDKVIVPANTFAATAEAVVHVGAEPVFVDIDPDDYTISPAAIEQALSPDVKAVIAVHIYGTPAKLNLIKAICASRGVLLLEDCAQAHLAQFNGTPIGTFGDAATFSFYPGKNLGAYGDAGCILVQKEEDAPKVRALIDHGRTGKKYVHDIVGSNQRMDAVQAAILSVKMKYIEEWTERRQALARFYNSQLEKLGYKTIQPACGATPVYHLYTVEVSNRDEITGHLLNKGIQTGVHYPIPLHRQPAFSPWGLPAGSLPVAERLAERTISLPLCPELSDQAATQVIAAFLEVAHP